MKLNVHIYNIFNIFQQKNTTGRYFRKYSRERVQNIAIANLFARNVIFFYYLFLLEYLKNCI